MTRHQPVSEERLEYELEASRFGMWVFLATEVLFFGALFCAFSVYRFLNYQAFAEATRHTDLFLGSLNTGVLLTSSLTMAIAVRLAKRERFTACSWALLATALLGAAFLSIKGLEWAHEIKENLWPGPQFEFPGQDATAARLFFGLYFCMTGLHAFHMIFGMAAVLVVAVLAAAGRLDKDNTAVVENTGLYWHFVDIVWIWLYPLLYLLGRSAR